MNQLEDSKLTAKDALSFATSAAESFKIVAGIEVKFDPKLAQLDLKDEAEGKGKGKKGSKKAEPTTAVQEVAG